MKKISILIAMLASFAIAPLANAAGYAGVSLSLGGASLSDTAKNITKAYDEFNSTATTSDSSDDDDDDSGLFGSLLDFDDMSFKAFAGYEVMDKISVEGSLYQGITTDLGDGSSIGLAGVYALSLADGGFDGFIKLGLHNWDLERKLLVLDIEDDATTANIDESEDENNGKIAIKGTALSTEEAKTYVLYDNDKKEEYKESSQKNSNWGTVIGAGGTMAVTDTLDARIDFERLSFDKDSDSKTKDVDDFAITVFTVGISYDF